MQRCKRCNVLMADQLTVCPTCGTPVEDAPEKEQPKPIVPQTAAPNQRSRPAPSDAERAPLAAGSGRQAPSAKRAAGKSKKRRSKRITTLALLIVAVLIVAAIVTVLALRCKGGSSAAAAPASAAVAAPETSLTRIETPNAVGLSAEEATNKLVELGLAVDSYAADAFDPTQPSGTVLTQSPAAGEWLQKGDHVVLTVNELPLTLETLQITNRSGRITLGNIVEVCKTMDTTNPNFDYTLVIHAVEDYTFKGGFRCLTGSNESEPISRVSTQLLREGQSVKGFESAIPYADSIAWNFALEDWMGFHFENVTGYEIRLSSRVDAAYTATKTFLPEQVRSMALVDCLTASGRIRVDVPTPEALTVRIQDSGLTDGYTNAPSAGEKTPVWTVKFVVGSYLWLSVTVDGSNGEPLDGMQVTGTQFVKKGASPSTFTGASYTVTGDVMVISVPVPPDIGFDPYQIQWMELTSGNGAYTQRIKLR